MLKPKRLVLISRPIFYLPTLATYAVGLFVNHAAFSWNIIIGAVFFTVPMGLIIYGINDIADRESDAINPRKGGIDGAVLRPNEAKQLSLLITFTMIIFGLAFLAARQYGVLLAVAIIYLFAYTYSVEPLRLKTRPVLDSLSNGLWIAAIFLAGYWTNIQRFELTVPPLHMLSVIFLCAAALHALGTVLDYEADKASGDTTISVCLGKATTLLLCALAFTGAAISTRSLSIRICLILCAAVVCLGCRYSSHQAIRKICIITLFLLIVAAGLVAI